MAFLFHALNLMLFEQLLFQVSLGSQGREGLLSNPFTGRQNDS